MCVVGVLELVPFRWGVHHSHSLTVYRYMYSFVYECNIFVHVCVSLSE